MGARSWFCAPAFSCSRHFRNAGARERKFYTGTWERGNAERERIGTLNSRSCAEMRGALNPQPPHLFPNAWYLSSLSKEWALFFLKEWMLFLVVGHVFLFLRIFWNIDHSPHQGMQTTVYSPPPVNPLQSFVRTQSLSYIYHSSYE